ncbi:hypothetical protein FJZ53_02295 [Candidatus Woesearchaeota archaeon]|nr:hypothetical protein [Candidatus Woesearchaeota archaeon]
MTSYDLELILDKEGTEGLMKVYESIGEHGPPKSSWTLGFLENDFKKEYFQAKLDEAIASLGLGSLFDNEIRGYDEDIKTKFCRKASFFNDTYLADNNFQDSAGYENVSLNSAVKNMKKSYLHIQTTDHCSDVITFKHALDIASLKGSAKKMGEPDIEKIIEDYSSTLKTYTSNKKFIKKSESDQQNIFGKTLSKITSESLEDVMSCYKFDDAKSREYFESLKDRILEVKESPFTLMFNNNKRHGWFYVKKGLWSVSSALSGLGMIAAYSVFWYGAFKSGISFSNYLAGGVLGASVYLFVKGGSAWNKIVGKIDGKISQRLIVKNEPLKKSVISQKKIFTEPMI